MKDEVIMNVKPSAQRLYCFPRTCYCLLNAIIQVRDSEQFLAQRAH